MRTRSQSPLTDATASIAPPTSRALSLVVTTPAGVVAVPLPEKERVTLGRAPECDVVVPDASVSRTHATILRSPISIEDNGSRHGTVVLGQRVAAGERAPLPLGAVIELGRATLVLVRAASGAPQDAGSADVVVSDPSMREVYRLLDAIAPSPLPVLIQGESGTGKELFARAVHDRSPRAAGPFVAINCAALPETLLESELFGHEKGAFTGATHAKPGLFEAASRGTLFLDEIGDLALSTQGKLLRALESGEVTRLGSVRANRIDVRVVAATHRDLQAKVSSDEFRGDLYFRLNGFPVTLPPLRRRRGEIVPLAEAFLRRAAERLGRPPPTMAPETVEALLAYAWPGNVRELRNVVERAVALCTGALVVEVRHLMLPEGARVPLPVPRGLEAMDEKERIVEALSRTSGNQTEAAKLLGVSRQTLSKKLDAFGVGRPRKRVQ